MTESRGLGRDTLHDELLVRAYGGQQTRDSVLHLHPGTPIGRLFGSVVEKSHLVH